MNKLSSGVTQLMVDCSQHEKSGNQPVLAIRYAALPARASWYVAKSFLSETGNPDYSVVTDNSELLTIPLFSYTVKNRLESCLLAGFQMGTGVRSVSGKPVRHLILATGEPQPLEDGLLRVWLGYAVCFQDSESDIRN